jgi:ATP-dependent helicase/nuclease subunit B
VVPAGVLYVPARDVLVSAAAPLTAEEILAEKAKALRRSGLLLDDAEVLQAMEHGDAPRYLPVRFKDGDYSGEALATAEQLGALSRHIDETLRAMAKELRAGSVEADPWYRSQTDTACRFCDYAGACHFNEKDDRIRYMTKLRPQQVWELMTKQGKEGTAQ